MANVLGRSPEKLQQLAWDANIVQLAPLAKLRRRDNEIPNFLNDPDEHTANSLITSEQSNGFLRKPTIRTKQRLSSYTYKNLTVALSKAFDSGCGPGVVQALLNKEQDIAAIKNDDTRKAQLEQRDALLSKAIMSGKCDLVWVVAPQTSLDARNKGLKHALRHRDAAVARKLLECAAEPQIVSKEFLEAAGKGDLFVLELLLSAPQPLQNDLLLSAIPLAVSSGSLQALQRIVEFTNFEGWLEPDAIKIALQSVRYDMLLVLLFAARQVTSDFLAREVLMLVQHPQASGEMTLSLLQALLYAGATGNDCSAALRIAAENRDLGIVRLLVSNGVDVNWGQGVIVKDLVRSARPDLLRALLRGSNVSASSTSSAVADLPKNMQEAARLEILDILIEFGARGRPLEDEIVIAVQKNHTQIVQLLREKGVSIDNRAGDALIAAIQTQNLVLLRKLLEGPVDQNSMQKALPYTQNVNKPLRLDFMQPLLQARVEGDTLHALLRDIVAEHTSSGVDRVVDALLLAQADPTFEDGQSLKTAIRNANTALLAKLVQCPAGISESIASSLIPEVLRLRKSDSRPMLMRSVLQARPKPDNVSAAVLALLSEKGCDNEMIELIVSSGMVDVNYETILLQAATHSSLQALSAIAKLTDSHRDTMSAAVIRLLSSQAFSEDEKLERLRLLFSSARSSVRLNGAKVGLPAHIKYCQSSKEPGKLWPMKVFEYLLASGADPSSDGTILADVVGAGAIQLVKAFRADKSIKLSVDSSLPSIFKVADTNQQVELLQVLLEAAPSINALSKMLIIAADKSNHSVCKVLLDNGAMLEFEDCAAMRRAVHRQNEVLIEEVLARKPSTAILLAAFEEAKHIPDSSQKLVIVQALTRAGIPKDFVSGYLTEVLNEKQVFEELVHLLLQEKADPSFDQYRSIVSASTRNNLGVLSVLFRYVADPAEAATKAFNTNVANDSVSTPYLPVLMLLLQHKASGPSLDTALIKAVHRNNQNSDLLPLITLLIASGAKTNASQGEALCIASGKGQPEVVSAIFKAGICPDVSSRSRALQYLIDSPAGADNFCAILRLLTDTSAVPDGIKASTNRPKFNFTPNIESPIRRFLTKRPRDEMALGKLLSCGCEALQRGADDLTIIWAMCQAPTRVSTGCVKLLIEAGANVKCINPDDNNTTLHIAILTGRSRLLKLCLDRGADMYAANKSGVTPLLMATHYGDASAVDTLMLNGFPKDDGSLHEAVTALKLEVVETLLKHGHDPNFPSQLSQGRSVLAHLLYRGKADPSNLLVVRKIIDLLLDHGAQTMKPVSRKPLICWALDNAQPIHMTSTLLQAYLYKYIDADFNLYHEEGYLYSPTMYVKRGKCSAPETCRVELQALLKNFGANRDVYYHTFGGAQPPDAVGMPEEIAHAERERREAASKAEQARREEEVTERRKEEAHKRALLRQQELHQSQIAGNERRFRLEQQMAEEAEKAEQNRMRSRHNVQLQLLADSETQRMNFRRREDEYQDARRKEDLHHQKRIADDEYTAFQRKEQLRIETQQQIEDNQAAAMKTQMEAQHKLLTEQNRFGEKAHQRTLNEIAMRKAVVTAALPIGGRTMGFIEG